MLELPLLVLVGLRAGSNCCSFSNGLGGPNVSHDLGHQTIDNNVFYTNCAGGAGLAPCAIDLDTDINGAGGVGWLSTSTWRNNLLYSPNSYGINYMTNETYSQANTGCCGLGTNASYATFVNNVWTASGNSQANPTLTALNYNWYILPQNFNLIPLSGLPAINGGTTSDYPRFILQV